MTIIVTDDLTGSFSDDMRVCAVVEGDPDPERAGFGANEVTALLRLIDAFPKGERDKLHGAEIVRIGVR